ncbi:hypothetical protein [Stenotrophomonas terrae]|nr:hypothetical protein [Stenotrophomonas terrae]
MRQPNHFPATPPSTARQLQAQPRGFGLVQAMLILLLVASALTAGALLLQSKATSRQASSQEKNLRWADEALVAFASTHSRLPCPAVQIGGAENCSDSSARWLPTASLASARGDGVSPGPIAYRVRPRLADTTDSSFLGNFYQPTDAEGNIRNADTIDGTDERPKFAAVNGLDLCRTLQQLSSTRVDTSAAQPDQALDTWAYGLAIAGPLASPGGRLDGSNQDGTVSRNDDAAFPMEVPAKQWDADYDDSVRVRTLDGVAQAVGCRMLPNAIVSLDAGNQTAVSGNGYYDTAQASIDSLAMAVSLHDSLAALKDNNVGNAELAQQDARAGVASATIAVLLSAGQITNTITSSITDFALLGADLVGCIFGGTTCHKLPVDASAIGLEIGSVIANAVAMGLNAGALKPSNDALTAHTNALARAKAANLPPPSNIEDALDQMERMLYGGELLNCEAVPVMDADGVTQKKDGAGQLMWTYVDDCDKNPEKSKKVYQIGLDAQVASARTQLERIAAHSGFLEQQRLFFWNDANIGSRIDTRGWQTQQGGRYVKYVWRCLISSEKTGGYSNSNCNQAAAADATVRYNWQQVAEFDRDKAVNDAVARRKIAETLAGYEKRGTELADEISEKRKELDRWKDTIIPQMESQMKSDCKGQSYQNYDVFNGNFEAMPTHVLRCVNAIAGLKYTKECKRKITTKVTNPATGAQSWVDKLIQEDQLAESDENYNANATCVPMMQKQLQRVESEQANLNSNIGTAQDRYKAAPAPLLNYPGEWSRGRIKETTTKDKDGRDVTTYAWETSASNKPYYAPEPFACNYFSMPCKGDKDTGYSGRPGTGIVGAPIWVASAELMLVGGSNPTQVADNCSKGSWFLTYIAGAYPGGTGTMCQRYPYSRAYADWLRAKEATVSAEENHASLKEQFDALEQQYKELRAMNLAPGGGGASAPSALGAECILVLADGRGSVGGDNTDCTP